MLQFDEAVRQPEFECGSQVLDSVPIMNELASLSKLSDDKGGCRGNESGIDLTGGGERSIRGFPTTALKGSHLGMVHLPSGHRRRFWCWIH
jgi:hypothetical protein